MTTTHAVRHTTYRTCFCVGSLLVIACGGFAAETGNAFANELSAPKTIEVNGQNLVPFFSLTKSELLTFHPYASLGGGYDSNVFLSPTGSEEHDTYLQGIIGAQVDWEPSERDQLQLRGGYNRIKNKKYDEVAGLRGGDVHLGYAHEGQVWSGFANGNWARTNDPLLDTFERALLDAWNADGRLDYLALKTRTSLGLTWNRDHYLDATSTFTSSSRDNDRIGVYARWAYEMSPANSVYLRAGPSRTLYNEYTQYSNSTGLIGVVGTERLVGSITSIKAEAGVTYKRYDDTLPTNTTITKKSFVAPQANLEGKYDYEEQSWLRLTGFSSLNDSASNSYASYYFGAKIDVRHRLLQNAGALASVEISEILDTDSGTQARERLVNRGARAGLEYQLREGLGVRVVGGYDLSTAEIASDYSRWTASAALNAAF